MDYSTWYTEYLKTYKRDLKPKTRESYAYLHAAFIAPIIGAIPLEDITPEDIQRTINAAADHGGRTAQLTYTLLHAVLRRAARSRRIGFNPADAIDKPTHSAACGRVLTAGEYNSLFDAIKNDLGLSLAVLAGLRRGEICGLQWRDVDLIHNVLHISRSRVRAGGQINVGTPKSAAGIRDIPILPQLAVLLRSAYQLRPTAYVYPYAPEHLNRVWRAIQRDAQITQPYRLHDLRHTFVTRILAAGCKPIIAQYIAGHSTLDLTLRVYTHVNADMAAQEIATLERRISGI